MLTVDFDRLGLRPGERVLDMGAGAGRHAFEAFRRGAEVTALDYGFDELPGVAALFEAMYEAGEVERASDAAAACVQGDGTRLPFADGTFDRIVCSEVLEHIPDDQAALAELFRVLRSGGVLAATVPTWFPEKVCWALSDEYYAPKSVGGHVRIFTQAGLREKMRAAGFEPGDSHHAHALHSPYWWLKCAVGPRNDDNPLVKAYHRLLVWDIAKAPRLTRWTERALNPVLGKSLVVYATKPPAGRHDVAGTDGARAGQGGDTDREAVGARS